MKRLCRCTVPLYDVSGPHVCCIQCGRRVFRRRPLEAIKMWLAIHAPWLWR